MVSEHIWEIIVTLLIIPGALLILKEILYQRRKTQEQNEVHQNNALVLEKLVLRLTEVREVLSSLDSGCNWTQQDSVNLAVIERSVER